VVAIQGMQKDISAYVCVCGWGGGGVRHLSWLRTPGAAGEMSWLMVCTSVLCLQQLLVMFGVLPLVSDLNRQVPTRQVLTLGPIIGLVLAAKSLLWGFFPPPPPPAPCRASAPRMRCSALLLHT
jgi:hypothetical protein